MTRQPHRNIEQMIEQQIREWELRKRAGAPERRRPTITVSRLPASGGREFAERLAQALRFDLFDREIVQRIADDAHLSEAVVDTLDERVRPRFTEWLMLIEKRNFLWPHQYIQHLVRVLGTIAQHGDAVILGRGSAFVLGSGESLRVSIVAPLEVRVHRFARKHGVDEAEARKRLTQLENERREFVKRSFGREMTDPTAYDLVFNTEFVTMEDAVAATRAVLVTHGFQLPEERTTEEQPAVT